MNIVELDRTAIQAIFPFEIEEERDKMIAGGNFIRVIAVVQYPNEVENNNWLSDLKRIKGNISIVQHIVPTSDNQMIDYYNKAIKNKSAELNACLDPKRQGELEREIDSARHQLKLAMDKKAGYVLFYTYILLQELTEKKLDDLENTVMMTLTKLSMKGIVPYTNMQPAYLSCLPLFNNKLEEYTYQMSNTDAVGSFYLFDDNELCNLKPGAVLEGINERTGSYISVDYKNKRKSLNRNKVVFGTSGIGKTTYLRHIISDAAAKGEYVYILDPENEYSRDVKLYGGTVIDFGAASKYRINPLEFFADNLLAEENDTYFQTLSDADKMDMLIKQKIQHLVSFWKQRKEDVTEVELSIIDTTLTELYKKKGLYERNPKELKHEYFPILADLLEELKLIKVNAPDDYRKIEDFIIILNADVNGSSNIFNGYTNVDLESRIICFNLKALQNEKKMQGACYYNITTFLWDKITIMYEIAKLNHWKDYAVNILAEEFHFILANKESADFFTQAYKRIRKYEGTMITSTQQIVDVAKKIKNMDVGAAIIQNSYTKVFFGMDDKGVDDLISSLSMKFSHREIALLKGRTQGKAIFIHGNKRVFLDNKLPREELRLFNPEEYEKKYNDSAAVMPDYLNQISISLSDRASIKALWGE